MRLANTFLDLLDIPMICRRFVVKVDEINKARLPTSAETPSSAARMEALEQRLFFTSIPIAADFSSARNGSGLTAINVNRVNLLDGNGFHLIGSSAGQQDNENDIDSESPYSSNGVLRSSVLTN